MQVHRRTPAVLAVAGFGAASRDLADRRSATAESMLDSRPLIASPQHGRDACVTVDVLRAASITHIEPRVQATRFMVDQPRTPIAAVGVMIV